MIKLIVFLSMIFLHIVDDFKFQGILANMKQESWWKKNYPNKRYKYDYIISLLIHAFSWDFMIHIPIIIYLFYYNMYDRDFIMFICIVIFANSLEKNVPVSPIFIENKRIVVIITVINQAIVTVDIQF